jgi:hypothetical protein
MSLRSVTNGKQFSESERAIMSRRLTSGKAASSARTRPLQLAVIGRHEQPNLPDSLTNPCTGHWLFQNIFDRRKCVATKPKPQKQTTQPGSAPKANKPAGQQQQPSNKSQPKGRNQSTGDTQVAGKLGGDSRRQQQPPQPKVKMTGTDGTQKVPEKVVATTRVTDFSQTQVDINYPQQRDMFGYHVGIFPAGAPDTLARQYFNTSVANGILQSLDKTLTAQIATQITNDHLADYINTLAQAYFTLKSVGNHISVLNSIGTSRPTLRLRAALVYDNYDIPFAIRDLAAAMSPHFLPPKVMTLIDELAKVYYVDNTPMCPLFQFQAWQSGFNTAGAYVGLLDTQRAAVEALTNARNISTGFSKKVFESSYITLKNLGPTDKYDDRTKVWDQFQKSVNYSGDMLDLWSNTPLEASHGLGTVVRHEVTTRNTGFYKSVFGKAYTALTNALTQEYIRDDTRYQPGILVPGRVGITGTGNNYKFIADDGTDDPVSVTLISAVQFGILGRTTNQMYETGNQLRISPSGSTYVTTTMNNVREDATDAVAKLIGVTK